MSDTEKPTPDSPSGGEADAKSTPASNVISIEQARAELLGRRRAKATPPAGPAAMARQRGREPPPPVTMPPGEHSAVIVTDTPAARAHIDKKTVHPGEAPEQTHAKKVRVKTQYDPRRQKTQITERRAAEAAAAAEAEAARESAPPASDDDVGSLWSQPPVEGETPGATPPGARPSLARPRPLPRESKPGAPLFLVGVVLAATIGAVVVYSLSRQKVPPGGAHTAITATVTSVAVPPPATGAPATSSGAAGEPPATASAPDTKAPATSAPVASEAPTTSTPVASGSPPAVVKTAPRTTATATGAAAGAPSTAPATTNVLPFGKQED